MAPLRREGGVVGSDALIVTGRRGHVDGCEGRHDCERPSRLETRESPRAAEVEPDVQSRREMM